MKNFWNLGVVAGFACTLLLCSCGGDSSFSSTEDDTSTAISAEDNLEDDDDGNLVRSSSSRGNDGSTSDKKRSGDDDDDDGYNDDDRLDDEGGSETGSSGTEKTPLSSSSVISAPTSKKACSSMTDADNATLDRLNRKTLQLLTDFVAKDLYAMAPAASYKESYRSLMNKYSSDGSACPAITIGYGVAFLEDVLNNETVVNLRDVFDNYNVVSWRNLDDHFVTSWLLTLKQTTSALGEDFVRAGQKTLRTTVIPALDSAIKYYEGVVKLGNFEYELENDDYLLQLDQSDFALALGSMYAMKAVFTVISSVNLDLSKNGSYQWTTYYNSINGYSYSYTSSQLDAMQHMADLLSGSTGLTAVLEGREKAWQSVPAILGSATLNLRKGLKHSLNDDDQEFDLFVVGDDANSEFSSGVIQQYIHALDALDDALDGNYSYEYTTGKSVTVNLKKFFAQTEGFVKYMPKLTCDGYDCYFVDLDGYPTISLTDARHGDFYKGYEADYFIFQDPTLGGVFPKLTQKTAWEFINHFVH